MLQDMRNDRLDSRKWTNITICLAITMFNSSCKAAWNRYFMLYLFARGFDASQVGVLKSSGIVFKVAAQLLAPIVVDSNIFSCCTAKGSSVLVCIIAILSGLGFTFGLENAPDKLHIMAGLKIGSSVSSGMLVVSDGLIMHECKQNGFKYSGIQTMAGCAWCTTMLVIGKVVDLYGYSALFLYIYCARFVMAFLLLSLTSGCQAADVADPTHCAEGTSMVALAETQKPFSFSDSFKFVMADHELRQLLFSSLSLGAFFVVVESITVVQMAREFKLSNEELGWASIVALAGQLTVFSSINRIISQMGHSSVIALGEFVGASFLVLSGLIQEEQAYLSIWLSFVRGASYALVTGAQMDLLVHRCPKELLNTLQAVNTLIW
eukprot:CAMPEP_0184304630 /NCGR_PEP_ID=MMETSP1049-20130417/14089_1 /TAXON_ID=77928 /ORGANISM="Proteomonas sulcata, Strain CCMP704" /LENGTH=377 /DNA_ID=CAMNT_0026616471 /DNA_START=517 /DNA_END=1647 /DNA_ORIENTATION=-